MFLDAYLAVVAKIFARFAGICIHFDNTAVQGAFDNACFAGCLSFCHRTGRCFVVRHSAAGGSVRNIFLIQSGIVLPDLLTGFTIQCKHIVQA